MSFKMVKDACDCDIKEVYISNISDQMYYENDEHANEDVRECAIAITRSNQGTHVVGFSSRRLMHKYLKWMKDQAKLPLTQKSPFQY